MYLPHTHIHTNAHTAPRRYAQGAVDGGMNIPHNARRFVGYDREAKSLDSDTLREHIFGGHVANYMTELKNDDPAKFKSQFGQFAAAGVTPDNYEDVLTGVQRYSPT